MPGIATDLYNDLIKPRKRVILYVFLIALFSTASYFAYTTLVKPRIAFYESFGADISNDNNRTNEATLMGFFADWCPHCKSAVPVWNQFTNGMKEKPIGVKYVMTAVTVDSSDGSDPRIQEYAVNGYPTVLIVKDGTVVRYEGKITEDSLDSFVKTTLST